MTTPLTLRVDGVGRVRAALERLKAEWRSSIAAKVIALTNEALQNARARAASEMRTRGRIEQNIHAAVTIKGNSAWGRLYSRDPAVRFQDRGFGGSENVAEHLRLLKQAFGRRINPIVVTVAAHRADFNYPGLSFMADALAAMKGEIRDELQGAVVDAAAEKFEA